MSASGSQTEFDFDDFDTDVSRKDEDAIIEAIAESIGRMRDQIDDDDLDGILRSTPAPYTFKSKYTTDQLDPEPFTKARVIEPLLETLGYDDYGYEAGDFSDTRGKQADYAISLRDVTSVDSSRLLIEAEPLNKPLEDRGHGLDQVKSWLSQREFESDYGFATDGIRWIFVRYDADSYTHNVISDVNLRPVFQRLHQNASTTNDPATEVVTDEERELVAELVRTFANTNFRSIIDDAQDVIKEKQEAVTDEFYDDYIKYVFGVAEGEDERRARSLVGDGVMPPDDADGDDTRLFSVDLMNRLIFIKFLEDKRIVRPDLLSTILDTYESGVYPQTMYKSFFDPLFYDVFNEKEDERESHIEDIDLYSEIPYLNGGLFRPELSNDSDVDERGFNVRDSVLESIIELLERYQFSVDGGPTDIDPSVLGSVFEKTINYLTTDPGDQNADLGAYYTPKEITRFSAEQTVRPALKERFERILIEDRGWPEAEIKQYDTLYELIDGLAASTDLITTLLNDVDDFYVVDPSMGSGHFLTSVVEEITNARQELWATIDETPRRHRVKQTTVQENIYGVDIMEPAVEIGKLRLWLSIVSELEAEDVDELSTEQLALPNITFNLRQGNSLIGYVGFPEETDDGLATFERWTEDSVRSRYEDVIEEINLHEEYKAFPEKAETHRQNALDLLEEYRSELDEQILDEFRHAVSDVTEDDLDEYTPFHWVLEYAEVYGDGGFDVIVGNPPWDRLRPTRDDYFVRYDETFESLLPEDKNERQEELLEDEQIAKGWEEYKHEIEIVSEYFHSVYSMQSPEIDGMTQRTENDLSSLFLERVFELAKDGGYVSQVLPGAIFNGASTKDLRMHLLDSTTIESIITFENRTIFPEIANMYNFGVLAFKNSGTTETLRGIFQEVGLDALQNFEDVSLSIPRSVMEKYSPEARIYPHLHSQQGVSVLERIVEHPPISAQNVDGWFADPYRELDRTNDSDRFVESEFDGDYPVYGGSNVYQFTYDTSFVDISEPDFWSVEEEADPDKSAKRRIREKNVRRLKKAIYTEFDGKGSQVQFVDSLLEDHRGTGLSKSDVLLDCTQPRIVFRDIARAKNERTMISAVIPEGIVCHNKLHTVRPYEINPSEDDLSEDPLHSVYDPIFSDKELFVALGLLNSVPFDYLMKTKVDSSLVMYKFKESQVPRLTEGDEWFDHIWTRAAKLNCYGDAFAEMRDRLDIEAATSPDERERIQAELDAGAFHAYGLDREQTEFVLDDFYQVQNPRRMTDEYFDLVLEKYDEFAR
jgi:type I restriction-modification system DNA methylase subunit